MSVRSERTGGPSPAFNSGQASHGSNFSKKTSDEEKFREASHLPLFVSHRTVTERSVHEFGGDRYYVPLSLNHVHLILTPQGADGMSRALGEAHRRYTNFINARAGGTVTYFRADSRRWPWTSHT